MRVIRVVTVIRVIRVIRFISIRVILWLLGLIRLFSFINPPSAQHIATLVLRKNKYLALRLEIIRITSSSFAFLLVLKVVRVI